MKNNSITYELLEKVSNYIKYLSMFLAGVFLVINIADILVSVFFRYFLSDSLVWTEEVARFTLIYSVMFGSVAALSFGDHVKITIVIDYLPDKIGTFFKYLVHILIIGIIGYMTYSGITYVDNAWRFQTLALQIPKAIPLMSIPIGMGLFLIQYILIEVLGINKDKVDEIMELRT